MKWLALACGLSLFPKVASTQPIEKSFLAPLSDEAFRAVSEFFQYDDNDLDADIVERQEADEFIQEKIVFTSVLNERVPSLLFLPKTGRSPFSLVIIIPGGDGRKEQLIEETHYYSKYRDELIAKGYAVFALDVQYHGERKANNNYREAVAAHQLANGWRELAVQTTLDHRRALDYLTTREEIDISRVACVGRSMGGILTFILTGVEPRIRVAAAGVPLIWTPTMWSSLGFDGLPFVQSVIGSQNFAPRINGRPILLQLGRTDRYHKPQEGQELFRLIDSESKKLIWFDSGHTLPRDQERINALNWVFDHL